MITMIVTKTFKPSDTPRSFSLRKFAPDAKENDQIEIVINKSISHPEYFVSIADVHPEIDVEQGESLLFVYVNGKWTCPEIGFEYCQSMIMHHMIELRNSGYVLNIDQFINKCWKAKNTEKQYYGMKYQGYKDFPSLKTIDLEKSEMRYLNKNI